MKVVAALVVLVLLLLASPGVSQAPDDKLIVPGQRIGKWTLEMTIDTLLQMNGLQNLPPFIGPSPVYPMRRWYSDSNSEIWGQEWFNLHFQAATRGRDAQRLEYVFIESDEFKTDKDIAVGVTRQVVENAYGQPTAVTRIADPRVGTLRLIYDEIGLATVIDRNEIVVKVCVFRARTARALWNF
ncbi:MAG: hypothetical protein E6H05_13545 [Bacillati bacterium ANGP1]|uniref:Uncharacterized protein n=1 Tax=Candidatus Segetimicrobium genomatis TaxID=2569760 RepID=A0A537IH88_9BACT|nr:MAG: hypothetical protein E6H05_13545 [Terrabacteria group bacterium ANGP1]